MLTFNEYCESKDINELEIPPKPAGFKMSDDDWHHTYKSGNLETALDYAKQTVLGQLADRLENLTSEIYPRLYQIAHRGDVSFEKLETFAVSLLKQALGLK